MIIWDSLFEISKHFWNAVFFPIKKDLFHVKDLSSQNELKIHTKPVGLKGLMFCFVLVKHIKWLIQISEL